MATERQIQANRENAKNCTGPKSPEGKAVSSRNALKTGIDAKSKIIPTEESAAHELLSTEYYKRFAPATPEERHLVDALISSEWLHRRYLAIENSQWTARMKSPNPDPDDLAEAFCRGAEYFSRIERRINSVLRNHERSLKSLIALQAKRLSQTAETPVPASENDAATEPLDTELVSFHTSPPAALPDTPSTAPQPLEFPAPAPASPPQIPINHQDQPPLAA